MNLQLDLRESALRNSVAGGGGGGGGGAGGGQQQGGAAVGPCSDPFDHSASYDFTDDGTLRLHGFRIKDSGISATPDGASCLMMPRHTKDCLVVLEELGQGAAGRVYKALHVPTLRLIALKVFRVHDEARRRQLVTELRCAPEGLRAAGPTAGAGGGMLVGGGGAAAAGGGGGGGGGGGSTSGRIGNRKAFVADAASAELAAATAAAKGNGNGNGNGGSGSGSGSSDGCPYLVSYFDAFCDQQKGTVSVVLEYMDAGTLQDLISAGVRCNERVLASIALSCLRGLDHIHRNMRKLHRDIKASNVLISKSGEVKISDFGLAKDLDCTADLASTFIGTLLYMSPERIAGKPYSFASDIWSLGLTLFACAAGQLPLPVAEGYWGVVHAVQTLPPPSLASYGDFSPELQDFVARMLRKDPAARSSAAELLQHPFIAAKYVPPVKRSTPLSGAATPGQRRQLNELVAAVREWRAHRHAAAHGGAQPGGRRTMHDSIDGHPLGKAPRVALSTNHLKSFADQFGVSYETAFNALKDQYKFEEQARQSTEI